MEGLYLPVGDHHHLFMSFQAKRLSFTQIL
jgi:hypothetical protein